MPTPQLERWHTSTLEEHVALIKRQVDRSLRDAETIQLARKVTGQKPDGWLRHSDGRLYPYVEAWGEKFVLPRADKPCAMRDARCEINAIWDFVVANVRYVYDPPDYDLFCTAEMTLKSGSADCDDDTILLASLLKAVGFEHVAARIVTQSGKSWEHVYAMVGLPKEHPTEWVPLDPTVDGSVPGWQYEGVKDYRDFYL